MAEFLKADAVAYRGGVMDPSNLNVGYLENKNRVVRLPFTVGKSGANEFSFLFADAYLNYTIDGAGDADKFAFVVAPQDGKSYADHNGADAGDIGDGTLVFESTGVTNMYNISGSVKKVLLAGDYYLWLFPNYKGTSLWANFRIGSACVATYELSGAAGVVRIKEGDKELICIPMVKEGGTLLQLSATIKSGDSLIYCV